ncbi:MAG TPA: NmrA family NAD(P)-binding protein [Propionicimonas sp.]|jgi:uncharacterized protein YbjT (DUF2867 family)|uniref:NmrA family NAD(P)-binding protein n=1 Tax=Propionicimonas sp. TaxID=1955623 RepID=UPI002F40BD2F
MTEPSPATRRVLVVGGTGHVGGLVIDDLLGRGARVTALVRPGKDPTRLRTRGVGIAIGDMLDQESLVRAMTGVDAVISTAAGYTRRSKQATEIDTVGNTNLAEAAARAGVGRFIFTSILTCDQTPQVPHFWHKWLMEDRLEQLGVPFVALRPGAFLDQVASMGGDPFTNGRLRWIGSAAVPLTFVLTTDLASYLARAVDANIRPGERVDIGWDRPLSMQEVASIASRLVGRKVSVASLPTWLMRALGMVMPPMKDMAAMVDWFATGNYVADTHRQAELFGTVPKAEDAIARFAERLGHRVTSAGTAPAPGRA